jgi:hypothetical protein
MGIFNKKKEAVDDVHHENAPMNDKKPLSKADEAQAERDIRNADSEG